MNPGTKKDWDDLKMYVLIGNKVQPIKLTDFPRKDFIVKTLHHEDQSSANKRIGATVQLQEILEALGFRYVEETPAERARYERRKEFINSKLKTQAE